MIAATTAAVIRLSVDPGTSRYATTALNRHDSAMPCQRHDRTTPERPAARSAVSTRSSTVNSNLTFTGVRCSAGPGRQRAFPDLIAPEALHRDVSVGSRPADQQQTVERLHPREQP